MRYDVVIIGSGVGGLSIAALLAKRGLKVVVLERQSVIGGRATSFNYQGHILDLGPHYFGAIDAGGLLTLLDEVGAKVDFVDTQRGALHKDGKYTSLHLTKLGGLLKRRELLDALPIISILRSASEEMIDELDEISVEDFVTARTDSETIFEILRCTTLLSHTMDDLSEASAGELARHMRFEAVSKRPMTYPKEGGCRAVSDALFDTIKRLGGDVLRGEEVVDGIIKNNKIYGVISRSFLPKRDKEIYAPIVISNIPIQDTFKAIPADYFPKSYVNRILSLKGQITCGVGVIAGLSSPLFSYTGPIMIHKPDDHIRYLVCPSNITKSVSPVGKSYLFYGNWVPPEFLKDSKKLEEANMILSAELLEMFPGAKDKIEWMTMGTMDRVDSLAKKPGLTGKCKPDVESPIEGLFFVGDSVSGGGSGIVSIIDSVRLCENRVISKIRDSGIKAF